MATIDDVQAAVASLDGAVDALIAKAQADAAVTLDFQPVLDLLAPVEAKIQAVLAPAG